MMYPRKVRTWKLRPRQGSTGTLRLVSEFESVHGFVQILPTVQEAQRMVRRHVVDITMVTQV